MFLKFREATELAGSGGGGSAGTARGRGAGRGPVNLATAAGRQRFAARLRPAAPLFDLSGETETRAVARFCWRAATGYLPTLLSEGSRPK
jgi:hypothetical protein